MKKYLYSLAIAAAAFGMTSCDSTQEEPHIQWYPVVTLEGEDTYYLELGQDFTLPGFTAVNTLTGEDASSAVTVLIYDVIAGEYVESISTASPAMYNVYYISKASEVSPSPDYDMYKQRDIYVYDPTVEVDLSGTWMVNADESYRVRYAGANAGQELSFAEVAEANGNDISAGLPVVISQVLPGFFYVDDISAGLIAYVYDYINSYAGYPAWYWQNYAYITLNSENEISYLTGGFGYTPWEGNYGVTAFEDGVYNPEDGTISYIVDLGGQGFYLDVVLQKP